jgi:hypothetical protein
LQISAGGAHALPVGTAQPVVQVPKPVDPQVVVQDVATPAQQANPLSQPLTQSSSRPLHVSAGGVQAEPPGMPQVAVQVPEPVEPQVVVQETAVPEQQA